MSDSVMNVGWVHHPFFHRHETGDSHPERAARLSAVCRALDESGLLRKMRAIDFYPAGSDVLAYVHEPAYIELIRMVCDEGIPCIGSRETRICRESFDSAAMAVGGVIAACDAVMRGEVDRAFCAVRPPGHHAGPGQAEGYCLFNNVAIAAEHLVRRHGLQRIAIIDWDVHHGNGTQEIFLTRGDVLYVSLHEDPEHLYPHSGFGDETGSGAGSGFTLNCPMVPGSRDSAYHRAFEERVIPAVIGYCPQFVLISCGFDAAATDRTADIQLTPDCFAWMTRRMIEVCECCGSPGPVSVLEGGYDIYTLERCAKAHVAALFG